MYFTHENSQEPYSHLSLSIFLGFSYCVFHKIFKQPKNLISSNTLYPLWCIRVKEYNTEYKNFLIILYSIHYQQTIESGPPVLQEIKKFQGDPEE